MIERTGSYWYNYKTQEHEFLQDTPTDFANYIPQIPAAQSLYGLYINHMEHTSIEAAIKVLEACIPCQETTIDDGATP